MTSGSTGPDHPVGDGPDMHARAARGDDHAIGKRRPTEKVDRDNVVGLGVFKGFNDGLQ
jgi:hypothetical protein